MRYVLQIPYRQLEGVLLSLQEYYNFPKIADYSTLQRRINKAGKNITSEGNTNYSTIILDSTGISTSNRSDYLGKKWGKKRPHIKLHIAVNENGDIVSSWVTPEKGGGYGKIGFEMLKALPPKKKCIYVDGSYDTK